MSETAEELHNIFARRRERLEAQEDCTLSDWDISILLDCSERHVRHLMSWPDDEIRPAYVLALEYAREVGVDECDRIVATRPDTFETLLKEVTLSPTEVAHMLGIDRSTLYRYTQDDRELDVPRHHYLALLYIHHLYGRGAEPQACRQHIEVYAGE